MKPPRIQVDDLFDIIYEDFNCCIEESNKIISISNCMKTYPLNYQNNNYDIEFNLLSLNWTKRNIPVELEYELNNIINRIIQTNSQLYNLVSEFENIFDFIDLYYRYIPNEKIKLTKRESPDFFLYVNNEVVSVEIRKSTTPHLEKFDKILQFSPDITPDARRKYQNEKHRGSIDQYYFDTNNGLSISSPSKGLVSPDSFTKLIFEAIDDKLIKYSKFIIDTTVNFILIIHNNFGLDSKQDLEKVSDHISDNPNTKNSPVTAIFIKNHNRLYEFSITGKLLKTYLL